ncbi:MAG: hypothetical protein L0I24_12960 [Pseudonocardia sp.]|nr:hypothetical protein [Pseudonocardia sp.]
MTTPGGDDIENRISRLEREIVVLRERLAQSAADSSAARVLASGADRDVSEVRAELRAHVSALNALRETQLELREAQLEMGAEMTREFAAVRSELRSEIAGLRTEMREGFATVHTGMAQIVALITNIERDQP